MYQFFIEAHEVGEDGIHIRNPENINHIKNVLRMRPGEKIRLCCQETGREYLCSLDKLSPEEILARIEDICGESRELPCRITLFQGLPKGDKMEMIIQKAVELGADRIVPVTMKRCIMKLDEKKAAKKVERWNLIARSAAKQSGRNRIPEVAGVHSFQDALQEAGRMEAILIPYEDAKGMSHTRQILADMKNKTSLAVFIGPEGGFEKSEVQAVEEAGGYSITLGHRILRTETAGLTTLSILMYLMEED
ncbi:MAG: 16S rRNA (uracil(1498)-N(3))-methyltransferase [Eubacterium sp.]|nr:16S rRNA (uracil(1498)-N(3))-methyltransferase [Eubacterium sp.]